MNNCYTKRGDSEAGGALVREAEGLDWLRRHAAGTPINIPEVIAVDRRRLEMTRIDVGRWSAAAWEQLADGLAAIHHPRQPYYGFDGDNYIGRNPQKNHRCASWGAFFVDYRLAFQVGLVVDADIGERFSQVLAKHRGKLVSFLDRHCDYPNLVHGDLWHGNVLCDRLGRVWLIDPAVYFGDREVDIAMTEMFGGFGDAFYRRYRRLRPLSRHYPIKRSIYNLYHYLNHYNLFGGAYLGECERGFTVIAAL